MDSRIEIIRYRSEEVVGRWPSGPNGSVSAEGAVACFAAEGEDLVIFVDAQTDLEGFGIDLVLDLPEWQQSYVLVPDAVYDGNRFRVLDVPYPPMYDREQGQDAEPVVTDIPRLPVFHLLAGDASYPAIGLWNPREREARAILFQANVDLGYVGLRVEETHEGLSVRIQFPGVRSQGRYTMCKTRSPSVDRGASVAAGWSMEAHVTVLREEASSVDDLFKLL